MSRRVSPAPHRGSFRGQNVKVTKLHVLKVFREGSYPERLHCKYSVRSGVIREMEAGREAGRQGGMEAGRQGGREAGRQGDREAGRHGGREAGRQVGIEGVRGDPSEAG